MKYPAELYTPSPRPYQGLQELEYPFHDRTLMATSCGRICFDQEFGRVECAENPFGAKLLPMSPE